jgi:hypothetical protein
MALASIRRDVIRRPAVLLAVAVLVAGACSDLPHTQFEPPEGFIPFVADSNDDVGLGNDIAVTADGVPYVSYFGFEATLDPGEIAPARPVWAPSIPAVQVASVADDGAWTQGAVAQAEEFSNVPVPFGPSEVTSLKSLEPDNSNGTTIDVDEAGTRHVAWAANDGIWYASSADSSTAEQIESLGTTLNTAGPVGRPGIAVAGNVPWVAWTMNVAGGQEVHVATRQGNAWRDEIVARVDCTSCPDPLPTQIAMVASGPLVVYVDQSAEAVRSLEAVGSNWIPTVVADGVAGLGVSLDVTEDVPRVSFYAGDGSVELAERVGSSWRTTTVGDAGQVEPGSGNFAPTTGTAVDGEGSVYVAWFDADAGSVALARRADAGFEPVETAGTDGGRYPSLAVGPDGQVYLAWYAASTEDLLVGVLGRFQNILVAQPSPTPGIVPPAAPADCGEDGEIVLETSATSQAAFDVPCLVAPAGEQFELTFDNQDSSQAHNLATYTEEGGEELGATELVPGPITQTLPLGPLDAGDYFFNCQAHPLTMRGALAVIEGGGGGGGQ